MPRLRRGMHRFSGDEYWSCAIGSPPRTSWKRSLFHFSEWFLSFYRHAVVSGFHGCICHFGWKFWRKHHFSHPSYVSRACRTSFYQVIHTLPTFESAKIASLISTKNGLLRMLISFLTENLEKHVIFYSHSTFLGRSQTFWLTSDFCDYVFHFWQQIWKIQLCTVLFSGWKPVVLKN